MVKSKVKWLTIEEKVKSSDWRYFFVVLLCGFYIFIISWILMIFARTFPLGYDLIVISLFMGLIILIVAMGCSLGQFKSNLITKTVTKKVKVIEE